MRTRIIAFSVAAVLAGSSIANAQTAAPNSTAPGSTAPNPSASGTSDRGKAMPGSAANDVGGRSTTGPTATPPGTTEPATRAETFLTAGPNDFTADQIDEVEIYNTNNESIGEIEDVIMSNGKLTGYIVSVGGFLGIGENYVVINPEAVQLTYSDADKKWSAKMDTTKEALAAAPKFKYEGRWAK